MYSTLIVARMNPGAATEVANIFERFDRTEMPDLMGTRRRQLFAFHGLYFHVQDFDSDAGGEAIEAVRTHSLFTGVSSDLRPHIEPYDPATWRSPKDAMAERFYYWPKVS